MGEPQDWTYLITIIVALIVFFVSGVLWQQTDNADAVRDAYYRGVELGCARTLIEAEREMVDGELEYSAWICGQVVQSTKRNRAFESLDIP